jgi:hypothetical protein
MYNIKKGRFINFHPVFFSDVECSKSTGVKLLLLFRIVDILGQVNVVILFLITAQLGSRPPQGRRFTITHNQKHTHN